MLNLCHNGINIDTSTHLSVRTCSSSVSVSRFQDWRIGLKQNLCWREIYVEITNSCFLLHASTRLDLSDTSSAQLASKWGTVMIKVADIGLGKPPLRLASRSMDRSVIPRRLPQPTRSTRRFSQCGFKISGFGEFETICKFCQCSKMNVSKIWKFR